jgi:hypothetical protein
MRPGRLFLAVVLAVLAVVLAFPPAVEARHRGFNPLGALFGGIFGYHRYYHHRHIARRYEDEPTEDSRDTRRGRHHRITQSHEQAAPQEAAVEDQQPTEDAPDTRRGPHHGIAQPDEQAAPQQAAVVDQQPAEDATDTRHGRHRDTAQPNEQVAPKRAAVVDQQPTEDATDTRRGRHHGTAQPNEQAAPQQAAVVDQQPTEDATDTRRGRHRGTAQPNEQAAPQEAATEARQSSDQLQLATQAPPPASLSSLPSADFASIDDDFFGYVFTPSSYDTKLWAHGERDMILTVFNKGSAGASPNCGDQGTKRAAPLIEHIEQATRPNDEQNAALRELQAALSKAFDEIGTTCRDVAPITPTARLKAMQERLFAIRDAGLSIRVALAKFYDSLTNEQRAPFDTTELTASTDQKQNKGTQQSAAQICAAQVQAPYTWPAALIGRRVRPNEQQRVSLEALQKTLFGMAMYLKGACPSEAKMTPIARLDAAMHRLDGMLYAVIAISPALDDFYGQLSDEQKARFNSIDRTST